MQHWADSIEDAQQPILMSSRDGKLLKPVPAAARLSPARLLQCLQQACGKAHVAREARRMLCECWRMGGVPLACNTIAEWMTLHVRLHAAVIAGLSSTP